MDEGKKERNINLLGGSFQLQNRELFSRDRLHKNNLNFPIF